MITFSGTSVSLKPLLDGQLDEISTRNTDDSRFTDKPSMPPVGAAFLMCPIHPSLLVVIALQFLSPMSCKHICLKSFKSKNTEGPDEKSFTFTVIHEGLYSESFPMYTGSPNLQDLHEELKIPFHGLRPGIAFTTIDDLGEATAKLVREYLDGTTSFQSREYVIC